MQKRSVGGGLGPLVKAMSLALLAGLVLLGAPGQDLAGQEAGASAGDSAVRMVADEGAGAAFWPRWRGPSGQGVATDGSYPDRWSATENVLWKTPVPGTGNSSPIVWGDYVFLTTAYDGGRRVSVARVSSLGWPAVVGDGGARGAHGQQVALQERPCLCHAVHRRRAHLCLLRRARAVRA